LPPAGPPSCPTRRSSDLDTTGSRTLRTLAIVSYQTTSVTLLRRATARRLARCVAWVRPECRSSLRWRQDQGDCGGVADRPGPARSEEHTSELQSRENLVC